MWSPPCPRTHGGKAAPFVPTRRRTRREDDGEEEEDLDEEQEQENTKEKKTKKNLCGCVETDFKEDCY
jgi:hypothetical protein